MYYSLHIWIAVGGQNDIDILLLKFFSISVFSKTDIIVKCYVLHTKLLLWKSHLLNYLIKSNDNQQKTLSTTVVHCIGISHLKRKCFNAKGNRQSSVVFRLSYVYNPTK